MIKKPLACFSRMVLLVALFAVGFANAAEVNEDQAARQMSILLKSYYPPTIKTLQKLGTIVPYVAYVKTDGSLGHFDLEGAKPTFDLQKVGEYISLLYGNVLPKRDEYLVISIFAVTQLELEGKATFALTAMMEHQSGFGYQKVWPLEDTPEGLKINRPLQIKYEPVIFADD